MQKKIFIFLFCLLIIKNNFGSIYTENITEIEFQNENSEEVFILKYLDSKALVDSKQIFNYEKIKYLNDHFSYLKNFVFDILNICIPGKFCYEWQIKEEGINFEQIKYPDTEIFSLDPNKPLVCTKIKTINEKKIDYLCFKINSLQSWITGKN